MKVKKNKPGKQASKEALLSEALAEEVVRFREYHPPNRFSRNLRTMLIEFLMFEGAIEENYLQDLLYDLQGLFELLDTIQAEEASGH